MKALLPFLSESELYRLQNKYVLKAEYGPKTYELASELIPCEDKHSFAWWKDE